MKLRQIRARWAAWSKTPSGKRLTRVGRIAFLLAIIAFLLYRLTAIGWGDIVRALPTNSWFYALWALLYMVFPAADSVIYHTLWRIPVLRTLPVFLRKRVYSLDILAYSGDLYLYFWARKRIDLPAKRLARTVRDVTILSAFASVFTSFVLLGIFLVTDKLPFVHTPDLEWLQYVIVGGIVLMIAFVVGFRIRRRFFSLSGGKTALAFGTHVMRMLLIFGLQVAQWAVVYPHVSFDGWIILVSIFIFINQIPVVSNKDLIFVGVGVEMAAYTGISSASVAALLLSKTILDKVFNIIVYTYTSFSKPGMHKEDVRLEDLEAIDLEREAENDEGEV